MFSILACMAGWKGDRPLSIERGVVQQGVASLILNIGISAFTNTVEERKEGRGGGRRGREREGDGRREKGVLNVCDTSIMIKKHSLNLLFLDSECKLTTADMVNTPKYAAVWQLADINNRYVFHSGSLYGWMLVESSVHSSQCKEGGSGKPYWVL